jgi:hypothetical protein
MFICMHKFDKHKPSKQNANQSQPFIACGRGISYIFKSSSGGLCCGVSSVAGQPVRLWLY